MVDIENLLAWNLGLHGDGGGVPIELEVAWCVGVRGKEELATRIDGESSQIPVEILSAGKTVDLHRDTVFCAGGEDNLPAGPESGSLVEVARPRVGEDVNAWG